MSEPDRVIPFPRPHLVAHRGDAARFPENTIPALEAALRLGACFLEFDVQLTADGVPVLMHDPGLRRTTGCEAMVMDLQSHVVCAMSAGEPRRFGERFRDVRVPTLVAAIELLQLHPGVVAFIEIKTASVERFGARMVMDRVLDQLRPIAAQCVIISFDERALQLAEEDDDAFATGWILRDWDDPTRGSADAMAPRFLFSDHRIVPQHIQRYWDGPWQWVMYEVATVEHALALALRGAQLVETMAISELLLDTRFQAAPDT